MSHRSQLKFPHGVYVIGEWDGTVELDGITPVVSPFVKVGIARDVNSRMSQLQTANPRALLLLHWQLFPSFWRAKEIERAVHAEMRSGRTRGEWFEATPDQAVQCLEFVQ